MTNVLSSIEYPHWLIIAGAILLLLGFAGLALRQANLDTHPNDMTNDQEPSEAETDLTRTADYERAAKEKRKARWAESERELQEPANNRPSIIGEESK